MKGWKDGKKAFIYHTTSSDNLKRIQIEGFLIPVVENGVIYFSIDEPLMSYGTVILKSKKEWDLSKLDGCSSPPVVWHRSKISLAEFEISEV